MKPLAIDLFCGLSQPEFFLRANVTIKKLVAGRTQNPDHVRLRVGDEPPCALTPMRRSMGYLKNASLAAGLAGARHFWPSSREPIKRHVFEFPRLFVERSSLLVFASRPLPTQFTRRRVGALHGAVSLVRVWQNDRKMPATSSAVLAFFHSALVFVATNATGALSAAIGAPFLVGLGGGEGRSAQLTEQFIHRKIIT
jgi:hypothetical protein